MKSMGKPARTWFRSGIGKGILLLVCVVVACIWRNSPFGESYKALWTAPLPSFHLGTIPLPFFDHMGFFGLQLSIPLTVRQGINEIPMTLFFLVVTLEIRKEILFGEFKDRRRIILPTLVGLTGMALPSLVCLALVGGTSWNGAWTIPISTDIALSLAVLAVSARHLPRAMRPFMATVGLVDDIGGILLIAILFTTHFHLIGFIAAFLVSTLAYFAFRRFQPHLFSVMALLAVLWLCFLASGVTAALSGVVVAFIIPPRQHRNGHNFVCLYEALLTPLVDFAVVPLFLLANAGADLHFGPGQGFIPRLFFGVALGLFIGKTVSMFFTVKATVRMKVTELPSGIDNRKLLGTSFISGVGLKTCLFIVPLALADLQFQSNAILGIYAGMTLSAVAGTVILHSSKPVLQSGGSPVSKTA